MSDDRITADEAVERFRRIARLMAGRPEWCDGPDCYLHDSGAEHHVKPCPGAETFAAAIHELDDAAQPIVAAIVAELEKTLRGRLALRYLAARSAFTVRRRRLAWRLRRILR